jgi:hypothetical protein
LISSPRQKVIDLSCARANSAKREALSLKAPTERADSGIKIEWENHGDEEDNWAQGYADGAQNCPQGGPRYSQDGTESSSHCSQDWTESGPRYSQDGTEGGASCPQESAKADIANSIANDKAGSPPPRYRTDRIR